MGDAPPPEPAMPSEPINLMRGWPAPALLPSQLIAKASSHALSDPSIFTPGLLYGPDPGYEPAREAIASWLTDFYRPKQAVESSRLCITGGASQNLGCILDVFTDPGHTRAIWIVAPAYMLAFRIFDDAGFAGRMRGVPEDEEGVDLPYLRREMKKCEADWTEGSTRCKPGREWAKAYKHIIYCVPTFANPSSRTMSLEHRTELVKIAREFDALIVADDVYDMLQWPVDYAEGTSLEPMSRAHLPRLVDLDREVEGAAKDGFGNAVSNGSFSKIVGPGVRVGWCEGTERFAFGLSQCGTTASGGAPSQLTSTYMTELVVSGSLDKHIKHISRPAYARRYRLLVSTINEELVPLGFRLPQPSRKVIGGYFTWLRLPHSLSADMLATRCKDKGNVIIAPGSVFEVPGDEGSPKFDEHVRLCWAWVDEDKLVEGVRVVGAVAREMLAGGADSHVGGSGGGGFGAFK